MPARRGASAWDGRRGCGGEAWENGSADQSRILWGMSRRPLSPDEPSVDIAARVPLSYYSALLAESKRRHLSMGAILRERLGKCAGGGMADAPASETGGRKGPGGQVPAPPPQGAPPPVRPAGSAAHPGT